MASADTPSDSLFDTSYTFHLDSYSCIRGMYLGHIIFAYIVCISGVACFVTRLLPPLKWTHAWFGRIYILAMVWATATSTLIHNTGLPDGVLWSFLWVLCGMTIGWLVIVVYRQNMDKAAVQQLFEKGIPPAADANGTTSTSSKTASKVTVDRMLNQEKAAIAANRTFVQRLFSLKALHGTLMLTSWVNIAGRVFVTPLTSEFYCYTYPVYKPINTPRFAGANATAATYLPAYEAAAVAPWRKMGVTNWAVLLSVGPMVGGFFIGAVYSFAATKWGAARASSTPKGAVSLPAGQQLNGSV